MSRSRTITIFLLHVYYCMFKKYRKYQKRPATMQRFGLNPSQPTPPGSTPSIPSLFSRQPHPSTNHILQNANKLVLFSSGKMHILPIFMHLPTVCILYIFGIFLIFLGLISTTSKRNQDLKCLVLCPDYDTGTDTRHNTLSKYRDNKMINPYTVKAYCFEV